MEINYSSSVHDLKLLLQRFAFEKSFSEETGGGGRESNAHLAPYLTSICCYLLTQTSAVEQNLTRLRAFLAAPLDSWVRNSFEVRAPLFKEDYFVWDKVGVSGHGTTETAYFYWFYRRPLTCIMYAYVRTSLTRARDYFRGGKKYAKF